MKISYGQIYLARPNRHLLIEQDHIRVALGPKANRFRPAIDPLFRSAAWGYKNRVTGILLSGGLDDGVAGLWDIQCCGGATIVQDPESASFPELPNNTLQAMKPDHILEPEKIAEAIYTLSNERPRGVTQADEQDRIKAENEIEAGPNGHEPALNDIGLLAGYSCPECGGPLWKLNCGVPDRYRCRVGHSFTLSSLFEGCLEESEKHLYEALQVVEENMRAGNEMIKKAEETQHPATSVLRERVSRLERKAAAIREILYN
jgi:two-component system, chemotaxis family, protein-glutamate methylesterase/glutaminase